MSLPLRGAVAVLTRAAPGISEALVTEGAGLAPIDREAAALAAVANLACRQRVPVGEHSCVLAHPESVGTLPAAIGAAHQGVSLLINNAGMALPGRCEEITLADCASVFDINFWAGVRMTAAFLPTAAA